MADSRTVSSSQDFRWIISLCQDNERLCKEWVAYVTTLSNENRDLKRIVIQLETEKLALEERRDIQQRMIDAQQDLIYTLKSDISRPQECINPRNLVCEDSTPYFTQPKSPTNEFHPMTATDTYPADILLALAEPAESQHGM